MYGPFFIVKCEKIGKYFWNLSDFLKVKKNLRRNY